MALVTVTALMYLEKRTMRAAKSLAPRKEEFSDLEFDAKYIKSGCSDSKGRRDEGEKGRRDERTKGHGK